MDFFFFLVSEDKPQESDKHQQPSLRPLLGLIHEAQACPLTASPALCAQKNIAAALQAAAGLSEEPRP
jgi:hypothetical protein